MNDLMEYKGYHAKIIYSADDNMLIGNVIGINDVISFHGSSLEELSSKFSEMIDDYLEYCKRTGKNPDKEYKGSFNVRIGAENHRNLEMEAIQNNVSINKMLTDILTERYL